MASPFASVIRFFRLPDLRKRFFIVLGIIAISRFIYAIPLPGVDRAQLSGYLNTNPAFSLLNIFTGGGLVNFSIALMGVGPYITASIIMQLLTLVIPSLEALSKEGEFGKRKINQWTRLATIPLAFIQGFGTLTFLKNANILTQWTAWHLLFMLVIATAGSMLLVWLGELISEQGIGNGLSTMVAVGIIASFPTYLQQSYQRYSGGLQGTEILELIGFVVLGAVALLLIIAMNEATRNLPVSYARRVRGNQSYGGVDTTLPIKVNASGVVPIIFAISMVLFPTILAQFLTQAKSLKVQHAGTDITNFFNNHLYYGLIYFVLVVAFTYFYTFIIFQPHQMAENLQKQGGFIPGIRPGKDTEVYLYSVIQRLTFVGALFLALIAILPLLTQQLTKVQTISLGGTSLLIVVAVILEIMRQVRAQLLTRTYDSYI
jgi:preprotein translocase subunit SecY